MFTFITSLLNRSCNIPGLISRKILDGICENDISATLLDNPLSILPNSLKKNNSQSKRKQTQTHASFLMVLLCRQEPASLPSATPNPLRPVSQLEVQWVIQSLNCSLDIQKADLFLFLVQQQNPKWIHFSLYLFITC